MKKRGEKSYQYYQHYTSYHESGIFQHLHFGLPSFAGHLLHGEVVSAAVVFRSDEADGGVAAQLATHHAGLLHAEVPAADGPQAALAVHRQDGGGRAAADRLVEKYAWRRLAVA